MAADIVDLPFMQGFIRLCNDGWDQGWHERNGGNASYRMTEADLAEARPFLNLGDDAPWIPLEVEAQNLAGECFVVTAAGSYMRNIAAHPDRYLGIVELDEHGAAYRVRWGYNGGGRPTSELFSHILNQSVRKRATDGRCRVIYHAHPTNIIAMSYVLPLDAGTFTRALWRAMTECVMVFPQGIGVVPVMVPGSAEIAEASSKLFETYDAVVWSLHGLFVTGEDFDGTFGLMHCVEKAAAIYNTARSINGGSDRFLNTISDDDLRAIAQALHLELNEALLNE